MAAEPQLTPDQMPPSTVTLGEITFDPVSVTDFRLSIEGTSNTGKSNTLAVILEDLADVHLPTLIIERLGALTPVRFEDDNLIVVGARDEEGIDLAVALEELDNIGSWILDHGRKILLDISTYAEYQADDSRVHEAAARALRSLNDRAHEKYRSGDRTKSLLIVDEAHILAPKDSAPEPELDDYVKRCRGQLIKASTEGGNKGISIITAYQRRAFLHNGVIQLCEDYVAHKPGDEDIDRTADALRCDPDQLAKLGTGEILGRGSTITDGDLIGPTTVRKRRSPDPREETFELPDVSGETESFLEEIAEEVKAEREQRRERQNELERLRSENERLRDRVEELEQELADTNRLADALSNLQSGGTAAQDVGEGVEGLQERVEELKSERDDLEERVELLQEEKARVEAENRDLEESIADLEAELQEIRTAFDTAANHVAKLADTFGAAVEIDAPDPAPVHDSELEERVAELKAKNERLREQVDVEIDEQLEAYEDFLQLDEVQEAIETAKDQVTCSPRYVKGVLAAIIAEGGPVNYDSIAERLDVSTTSDVSKAASGLERRKILMKDRRDDGMYVDLNVDGIAEIRRAAAEREKTEQLMEGL